MRDSQIIQCFAVALVKIQRWKVSSNAVNIMDFRSREQRSLIKSWPTLPLHKDEFSWYQEVPFRVPKEGGNQQSYQTMCL